MVALHFATATWREDDAVLWIVDCEAVHRLLPDALRASLEQEGSLVFKHAIDPAELDALVQDEPFALFFEPPSLDDRIVNQAAVLSVIADPQLQMDEWLAEHPDTFRGLRIPSELSARRVAVSTRRTSRSGSLPPVGRTHALAQALLLASLDVRRGAARNADGAALSGT